jgi:hypothetical protein
VRYFVLPDLHGQGDSLVGLLRAAGLADELGEPTGREDVTVISLGDLINGTMPDWDADADILRRAEPLVDVWIAGNHDAVYMLDLHHIAFGGFSPNPAVATAVARWTRSGRVAPCARIGNTLLSHAGVGAAFDFATAADAQLAIERVWAEPLDYIEARMQSSTYVRSRDLTFADGRGGERTVPAGMLLDGITADRGGNKPHGGILWADWSEPKNENFSQVLGHTRNPDGPVLVQRLRAGTFTVNLDTGGGKGNEPVGLWLDEDGEIVDFVDPREPEFQVTFEPEGSEEW